MPQTQQLSDFTPISADVVWVIGHSDDTHPTQRVLRSATAGRTWAVVTPSGLGRATARARLLTGSFLSADEAWLGVGDELGQGVRMRVLATTDAGATWVRRGSLPVGDCSLQFVNPMDGWCVATTGSPDRQHVAIFRTTDGGRAWTQVASTGTGTRGTLPVEGDVTVTFSTATDGLATYSDAVGLPAIYATEDAGAHWYRRQVDEPDVSMAGGGSFAKPTFTGAESAVALYTNRTGGLVRTIVYRSTDGGKVWTPVFPPGRPKIWGVDLLTATNWRLVSGATILATDDAGRTWTHRLIHRQLTSPGSTGGVVFVNAHVAWDPSPFGPDLLRTVDAGSTWTALRLPGGQLR